MKTYKYILLDWDGNLAKTLEVWLEATRTILERRGIVLSDEEIATSFGSFTIRWPAWGVTDMDVALDEVDKLAKLKLPNVELYPDALEVLEKLHSAGKQLALITTSSHENVKHVIKKYNLSRFLSVIVAADDVTHRKPHPEPLEKALKQLHGTKDNAIMIGDTENDVKAAYAAGVDSILFYPPEHKKYYDLAELQKHSPTYTISDFREVLNIV